MSNDILCPTRGLSLMKFLISDNNSVIDELLSSSSWVIPVNINILSDTHLPGLTVFINSFTTFPPSNKDKPTSIISSVLGSSPVVSRSNAINSSLGSITEFL